MAIQQLYSQYACLCSCIFQFNWHFCTCVFKLIPGFYLLCSFPIWCWGHPRVFFSPTFKNPFYFTLSCWMIHLTTILDMYIVKAFNDFIPCLYLLSLHVVIFSVSLIFIFIKYSLPSQHSLSFLPFTDFLCRVKWPKRLVCQPANICPHHWCRCSWTQNSNRSVWGPFSNSI